MCSRTAATKKKPSSVNPKGARPVPGNRGSRWREGGIDLRRKKQCSHNQEKRDVPGGVPGGREGEILTPIDYLYGEIIPVSSPVKEFKTGTGGITIPSAPKA